MNQQDPETDLVSNRFAKQVRFIPNLEFAWRVIRRNGQRSTSADTRREISEFSEDAGKHIRGIARQLRENRFVFEPALGVAGRKGQGKGRRPLVIAPIPSRIVQRSIHDVILRVPKISEHINNPHSFGGVKKRDDDGRSAVPAAIAQTIRCLEKGAIYYIRSDIKSFFDKVPKSRIIKLIGNEIKDSEFMGLLYESIKVELKNMASLRIHANLFPIHDIGVAQGNSLSPLMGNMLLYEFDIMMNSADCWCLRYIDDFLVLAPSKASAWKAFKVAQHFLKRYDMVAYHPRKEKHKAQCGDVHKGFDFLGISLKNGGIKPSRASRTKFLKSIKQAFDESLIHMDNVDVTNFNYNKSLASTMKTASGMIMGWGNQYKFCNERNIFKTLDNNIDERIRNYLHDYSIKRKHNESSVNKRRILGVYSLADCKQDPMIWAANSKAGVH